MKNMHDKETVETILGQIKDPAVRAVAEHSLKTARKALDMSEYSRVQFVVDEIHKIMPKALRLRSNHEAS
jgi:ArsR family metal-binding transcriptional regulator